LSVTDEGLPNNERYEAEFDKGDLPAAAGPETRRGRVHGRARLDVHKILGSTRETPT
jgi:hypothetical protein